MGFQVTIKGALRGADAALRGVVPLVSCVIIERRLRRKLEETEAKGLPPDQAWAVYLGAKVEDLKESHEIELRRRAAAQERVKGNVLAITIMTTLLGGAFVLLKHADGRWSVDLCVRILLTCAVVWLVMSGIACILAISPEKQFNHWLQTRGKVDDAEGDGGLEKTRIITMILLNQGYTIITLNYVIASFDCLRNASLAIAVVAVLVFWSL